jgi:putative ABC transport system permease protein
MNNVIALDITDLGWLIGLLGIAIALSYWQRLSLEGQLIFAAGRSLIQLLVVGYIIAAIFALNNPWAVFLILSIMISIAAIVANKRIAPKQSNLLPIVWGSIFVSSCLTVAYAIILMINPTPWYSPQYLIPLTGMLLGNAMNSASLAGERLSSLIEQNYREVETHLSLGATPKQAINTYQKEAIRVSLIPTMNQMMVVGMVSLPGMFTGQVLAGADPLDAASYQILILFMIVVTNLLTSILITEGVYRRFFNSNLQLII